MLINKIQNQLKTTNLSMKEIADNFNFASPSVFGRFFKKHTGITPLQYREGENSSQENIK